MRVAHNREPTSESSNLKPKLETTGKAAFGWDVFNQDALYKAHKKRVKTVTPHFLTPNTVELIPTLGALPPRTGPVLTWGKASTTLPSRVNLPHAINRKAHTKRAKTVTPSS